MLSGLSSYERARAAVETWGKDFDILEVHSFTPCDDLPLRIVGTREGPRSCFEKRLDGLKLVASLPEQADWYLACSDDNYVWRENLEDVLWPGVAPVLVGGHTNQLRIHDGTAVTYPSGGAGYCLNQSALELVVKSLPDLRAEWSRGSNNDDTEDIFIGWAAARLSIPYFETPGFYGCNPGRPEIGVEERRCERQCVAIENPISFHYVTVEQMRMFHAESLHKRELHKCEPTVPEVLPMVRAYYAKEGNSTGGNFHIVLDDGNWDDGSVKFCLNEARKTGDEDGVRLGELLLRMSRTQRLKLYLRQITARAGW